jgi:membrane-bound serine protease (ClpP class)
LLGQRGTVIDALSPDGKVFVLGEIWFATSSEPIEKGEKIVVTDVDGMQLMVARPSHADNRET